MSFDVALSVEIHRQSAIEVFGDRLDENRNVIGTDLFFDEFWRLRKRDYSMKCKTIKE